jgi:hypothetical protein
MPFPISVSLSEPTSDFSVQNEGTIFLLHPLTCAAKDWIHQNLSPDRLTFGEAVVVEHRFICDILNGICMAGLEAL